MTNIGQSTLTAANFSHCKKIYKSGVNFARYLSKNPDRGMPNSPKHRDEDDEIVKRGRPGGKILHRVSQTLADVPSKVQAKSSKLAKASLQKISGSVSAFDDFMGISAVREAQLKVREAEDLFMSFRKYVQDAEKELERVRMKLNEVRKRLDRVSRDDERYFSLATEEHAILLEEKRLKTTLRDCENKERDQFIVLSGIVRESHEKERERVERTKHWSVVGSVVGAALGVISSSVINYIRLKEVKSSVKGTGEELMERSSEILGMLSSQNSKLDANSFKIKEGLEAHCKQVDTRLTDLQNSIDTYTLSASISSGAGTVEAGISLKSLTEQLRELVQLQLAHERDSRIQEESMHSNVPNSIHNQIDNLKEENRNNFAELFVDLRSLSTKMEIAKEKVHEESSHKSVDELIQVAEDCDKNFQQAQYWSKIQVIVSVASISATLFLIALDIMK